MIISYRPIKYLISILIVICLIGCGNQKKEIRLVYQFSTDDIYYYVHDIKKSTIVYENDSMTYSGDKTYQISYMAETMENINDSKARLFYSYTMTGEKQEAKKDIKPKKWSSEIIMASNGKIVEFFPDSNISNESIEYYQKMFEQTSPMYPNGLISEGYTWNNSYKVLLDDGMTDASTTYKLKSIVREAGYDCAIIEYKGNMVIPLGNSCSEDTSVAVSGVDRIEVEGVTYFAYTKGITIREEEKSTMIREGTQLKDGKTTSFRIEEKRTTLTRLTDIEQR
jgi:hypothetical protein